MNHPSRTSQRGFSLVELMVVVAIIGVLASIAIPNIQKYIAKARQTEAKTNLSSIYTSEKAFYAEYTAYHSMFGAIGYSPEGLLRYNVGFAGAITDAGPTNGYNNPPSTAIGQSRTTVTYCNTNGGGSAGQITTVANGGAGCAVLFGANNQAPPTTPDTTTPTSFLNGTGFTATAAAVITTNGVTDGWSINDSKYIQNQSPAIQ
ncbi:MAG TPA: prepilin-type N-terminal cleavage/methylation domain-containing protein [Bdellovibrio sp.]|uniref:type IV pilin protein n=1 Tax=Bdellovibrio sp. TaxID=28201 RepID=UPI002EF841B7